jgi:hypothetical protein
MRNLRTAWLCVEQSGLGGEALSRESLSGEQEVGRMSHLPEDQGLLQEAIYLLRYLFFVFF